MMRLNMSESALEAMNLIRDLKFRKYLRYVCGGNMFLMSKFWAEYCEAEEGRIIGQDPGNFSMVLQEKRKLYACSFGTIKDTDTQ